MFVTLLRLREINYISRRKRALDFHSYPPVIFLLDGTQQGFQFVEPFLLFTHAFNVSSSCAQTVNLCCAASK